MKYSDKIKVSVIEDFIIPYRFRTVEDFSFAKAPDEVSIHIFLKDEMRKSLSFKTPWSGELYAYCAVSKGFNTTILNKGFSLKDVTLTFSDWDQEYVITLEIKGSKEELQYSVSKESVRLCLEGGLRITQQRIRNDIKEERGK